MTFLLSNLHGAKQEKLWVYVEDMFLHCYTRIYLGLGITTK